MTNFHGKTVLITGAAGGIGQAMAQGFAAEGANLVLCDREEAPLAAMAAAWGERACVAAGDVASPADSARAHALALARFGRIDVAVLNAGTEGAVAQLGDATLEDFERVMAVNVRGVFIGLTLLMPLMKQQKSGSIIIMSSTAGVRGSIGLAPYSASKHAVVGLMRTAALEGAAHNVRVNTVHPGPVETRMMRAIERGANAAAPEQVQAMVAAATPMKRYCSPQEVAHLVQFLAGDGASYCSGNTYMVDGGTMAGRA